MSNSDSYSHLDTDVEAGQAVYSPQFLNFYDVVVWGSTTISHGGARRASS